jgi:hypothetical protein
MPRLQFTDDEIVRRGQELYDRQIRQMVEPGHGGKFLALNIETGDYEIAAESVAAYDRAAAKDPDGVFYLVQVGRPTAVRLGGRFRVGEP